MRRLAYAAALPTMLALAFLLSSDPRPETGAPSLDASSFDAPSPGALPAGTPPPRSIKSVHGGQMPSDWFFRQRAWPHEDIPQAARLAAWEQARELHAAAAPAAPGLRAASWQPVGPVNIGGRIADVACHPTDANVVYVGAAEGGVFKTTDGGATWIPTFDDESSLSIGSVAVDPTNPNVVWVGTGEPNGGGGSVTYGGTGVFKSTNAGATWTNVGLENTRYIGRVAVCPTAPDRVFVAALGPYYSPGVDRGVYRTTDGGGAWQQVLAVNDWTGAVDLVVHPTDPNRVWAAMWERRRGPDFIDYGGDGSGLWRSTDGGDTWVELTSGLPAGPDVGRIGLAIAESSPDILYAIYAEADPGSFVGVYKSTNGGDSWVATNDSALSGVYATYGWWFGNIRVDPTNPNRVAVLGFDYYESTTGGASWFNAGSAMHVDHHGLDFAADGSWWEGNDGGLYRSPPTSSTWSHFGNLPITQFYTIEVDDQFPHRRYGGTQDNGTNRTLTGNDDDWHNLFGGDGFYCQVDPTNNQYVYVEYQYGNLYRSTNGGSTFNWGSSGLNGRKNWSMPVQLDPTIPSTLYAGTDKVHRSTSRAASWTAISPDLTDGAGAGNVTYGTITTLAVAPTNSSVILAGTDDGNVHVTTNGGGNWTRVDAALPDRWITRVAFDPSDDSIGYVTISGFRWDEPLPHVFRTTNHGGTWANISSNLPEAPVNDIIPDPGLPGVLYVATDFGVYRSGDLGGTWTAAGTGLPSGVVNDLELHVSTRTLTAATFGRSLWTLDVSAPVGVGGIASGDAGADRASRNAPELLPPRPNPAPGGRTVVAFTLGRPADISLVLYDVTGRRVVELARGSRAAGTHRIEWNGRNAAGEPVAAGVYLARLEGDGVSRTRRIVVGR